ncbi:MULTISPECIES: Ig-like domain-containing protein [Lysinibacillus]|uniref:Ig-like domain-containing protein n=1 Tax=Lysinibacillus TaxID=400634 RepID=UPI00289E46DC|nr:Ig-like domain-containing protein [Lysinibacillus boronitolerans]
MKKSLTVIICALFLFVSNSSFVYAAQDTEAPTIEEIKVLTPVVKAGSTAKIELTVSDNLSGIRYVNVHFKSPDGKNHLYPFDLSIDEPGELKGTYILESHVMAEFGILGEWTLDYISVQDFAFNTYSYFTNKGYEFLQNKSFIVEGFTSWETQQNVELNKEFTISFNSNIDISTILEKNIYIKDDARGENIPLMFIIDRSSDMQTSKVTIAPVGSYRSGSSYTLYIKDIISKDGQILNENVKMQFITK